MKFVEDIFKAYDIRGLVGGEDAELSPQIARAIGQAFADFLPEGGKVIVGRDMRNDSAELHTAFIEGVREQGRSVLDIGLVTTDMMYFATGHYKTAGGAMITASHNPGQYNGIKLCGKGVVPIGSESGLGEIKQAMKNDTFKAARTPGKLEQRDIRADWVKHALSFIDINRLQPYRITIDAGNGMAGVIVPLLEEQLPFSIEKLFTSPDGDFPNHPANPIEVANLQDLIRVMHDKNMDYGLAFDGDGDRAVLVDDRDRPVSPGTLGAIFVEYYLAKHPGATIVYDVRVSHIVRDTIEKLGGVGVVSKVGGSNIKALMRDRKAVLGIEQAAHYYFKDNFYADSGLIAALIALEIVSISGQQLSEIVDRFSSYVNSGEVNLPVGDVEAKLRELKMAYSDGEQDELDGLTVEYPDWWFNVRASNTEPLLRLSVESKDPTLTAQKLEELTKILSSK